MVHQILHRRLYVFLVCGGVQFLETATKYRRLFFALVHGLDRDLCVYRRVVEEFIVDLVANLRVSRLDLLVEVLPYFT